MQKRICFQCKEEKNLETGFYKNKNLPSGRKYQCKTCCSAYKRTDFYKDRTNKLAKDRYIPITSSREKRYKDQKSYIIDNLRTIKTRAQKNNIPFDITIEDIVIPEYCPILKTPLDFCANIKDPRKPNIDRIVPERGYVKGNVRVISAYANRIKSNCIDPKIFLALAEDAETIQRHINIGRIKNPEVDKAAPKDAALFLLPAKS